VDYFNKMAELVFATVFDIHMCILVCCIGD